MGSNYINDLNVYHDNTPNIMYNNSLYNNFTSYSLSSLLLAENYTSNEYQYQINQKFSEPFIEEYFENSFNKVFNKEGTKDKEDIEDSEENIKTNTMEKETLSNTDKSDEINEKKEIKKSKEIIEKSTKSSFLGRKKKNDTTERKHNKYSEDNIIVKIKRHIINHYIISLIEKNSSKKRKGLIKLKKLPGKFIVNLEKNSNIELLKTTIKEIYRKNISTEYTRLMTDYNIITIDEIYEKQEANILKIFELTLSEILIIFINGLDKEKDKNFDEIKSKIEGLNLIQKNEKDSYDSFIKKNKKDIKTNNFKDYLDKIKDLCIRYEDWFINK